jgi:peptidoglycan/xylan/chitin deacetylase (PgdA/CDA1 family)
MSTVVLAYHAIADRGDDPILRRYSVPPARFAKQLSSLAASGWTFIDPDLLLAALEGERELPPRAALVTFDDGYADFAHTAQPELSRRGIPAVVFAVTGHIGDANAWDQESGASPIDLMDADTLRRVAAEGVEVGSHGRNHRSMALLDPPALEAEAQDSAAELESLGVPRPRLFAYPYGHSTADSEAAVKDAGYRAAFTITPGVVARASNPYALPRVMVLRGYRPWILRLRLACLRWRSARLERWFDIVGTRG